MTRICLPFVRYTLKTPSPPADMPIPDRLNVALVGVVLAAAVMRRLDELIHPRTVAGARYDAVTQQEIGTEEFPSAA